MTDIDHLYGEARRKLLQARVTQGLSHVKLAQQLGISWASVVDYSWHGKHFDITFL
jgi:hypothetical protein